jgi:putative NADH-flavin reductase
MMEVIVFGATGQVGLQLVKQSLWKGWKVRAFGRNVFDITIENENLQLIRGALFDETEVFNALKNCDAVLSALGGGFDGTDKTRSLGMKNIVKQMDKSGCKRIVAIGGMGVLNGPEDGKLLMDMPEFPKEYLPVSNEHRAAYDVLKSSATGWTFVCPPDIKNGEATGVYHTAADYPPTPNQYRISAGDLALFMLNELEKNEYVKMRVGISN